LLQKKTRAQVSAQNSEWLRAHNEKVPATTREREGRARGHNGAVRWGCSIAPSQAN
jgi:hypothetical protein